ncbi:MAG: phosphatase PAP2 family protein [Desulfobulbaceae bacterium]|nr:phosphatase PAP2 family protein [Desulfobulbaceae bacterium]
MPFPPVTDQFFLTVTWLGALVVLLPTAAALAFCLHRCSKRREALLLIVGLGLTVISVHALKLLIKRPRPEIEHLLIPMPTSWSFPSAHAAQAAAFFFALAFIAARDLPKPVAKLTIIACLLVTLLIAYSRVYLQVHYPTDVLAGLVVGGGGVLVAAAMIMPPER